MSGARTARRAQSRQKGTLMTRLGLLPFALMLVLASPVLAQSQSGFGRAQDVGQPVEVTADALQVDQKTGLATFSGHVVIGQGEMRLAADRVTVTYAPAMRKRSAS